MTTNGVEWERKDEELVGTTIDGRVFRAFEMGACWQAVEETGGERIDLGTYVTGEEAVAECERVAAPQYDDIRTEAMAIIAANERYGRTYILVDMQAGPDASGLAWACETDECGRSVLVGGGACGPEMPYETALEYIARLEADGIPVSPH